MLNVVEIFLLMVYGAAEKVVFPYFILLVFRPGVKSATILLILSLEILQVGRVRIAVIRMRSFLVCYVFVESLKRVEVFLVVLSVINEDMIDTTMISVQARYLLLFVTKKYRVIIHALLVVTLEHAPLVSK